MKIKHRVLALILTAIMVLTFMPALAFAEDDENFSGEEILVGPIGVDVAEEVIIEEPYDYYRFVFKPNESDWYTFSSSGEADTVARVLKSTELIGENDDNGEDINFALKFYAEAGETYYLEATCLGGGTGSFEVTVNETEDGWWIINPDEDVEYEESETTVILDASEHLKWKGEKPVITHEWYQDNADPDADDYEWEKMEGKTSAKITVPAEQRYYKCKLTDSEGAADEIVFYVRGLNDDDEDDDYYEYDFGDLPEDLESVESIELDETKDVEVDENNPIVTFSFTPDEDGFYAFESYGGADPVGQVRTEDGIVAQNDDYDRDYNENGNNNFRIGFAGRAGTTYYLQARAIEIDNNISFRVKAYDAKWLAHAANAEGDSEDAPIEYNGTPVSLEVIIEGDLENGTFNWYRYNNLIQRNGGSTLDVSEGGRYYCQISDGSKSVKVYFYVSLESVSQNNLRFSYDYYDDTAYVESLRDDDTGASLTKGNVTIPSTSPKFADGRARTVTYVEIYDAPEMTSVTIPASVTDIWPGLGMKNTRWDVDDNLVSYELIPGFVIYSKTGSAAQTYANKYKIKFRDLEAEAAAEAKAKAAAAEKEKEAARQGTPDSKIAKVKMSKPAAAKKAVTAKWKKLSSKQVKKGKVKKYEIWVCPNKAFGASDTIMKEVSKSKSSGKVKVPKKGTYYVKVRAIRKAGGVKYVGKWSSPKKVKVKK